MGNQTNSDPLVGGSERTPIQVIGDQLVEAESVRLDEVREREGDLAYAGAVGATLVDYLVFGGKASVADTAPLRGLEYIARSVIEMSRERIVKIADDPQMHVAFISGLLEQLKPKSTR
jgi:hypothetical protein